MSSTSGRSPAPAPGAGLRLPRPPGVLRRFWARHPVAVDVLVAGLSALSALTGAPGNGAASPGALAPALVVAASAALLVRRRFPVAVYAVAAAVEVVFILTVPPRIALMVVFAGFALGRYTTAATAWRTFGISAAVWLALALVLLWRDGTALFDAAAAVGITLIGVLIGINVRNRRRYLDTLIELSRRLATERDQQAQLAAAAERERIARELHDIVAHSLTVMVTLADGVAAAADPDRVRRASEAIAGTGREALRDIRTTLGILRDPEPAPLQPTARDTTAESIAAARAAGLEATLTRTGDPSGLDGSLLLAISRIVQEAVTNVIRHADGAHRVDAKIRYAGTQVTVRVDDDGRTAAPGTGGFGLRGLRERVELLDGTIEAGPRAAGGWRVEAVLPRTEAGA